MLSISTPFLITALVIEAPSNSLSPIEVSPAGITASVSAVPANARSPMLFTVPLKVTLARLPQPSNALAPRFKPFALKVTLARFSQPSNAFAPTFAVLISMLSRAVQPSNMPLPMDVKSAVFTVLREVQPLNTFLPDILNLVISISSSEVQPSNASAETVPSLVAPETPFLSTPRLLSEVQFLNTLLPTRMVLVLLKSTSSSAVQLINASSKIILRSASATSIGSDSTKDTLLSAVQPLNACSLISITVLLMTISVILSLFLNASVSM